MGSVGESNGPLVDGAFLEHLSVPRHAYRIIRSVVPQNATRWRVFQQKGFEEVGQKKHKNIHSNNPRDGGKVAGNAPRARRPELCTFTAADLTHTHTHSTEPRASALRKPLRRFCSGERRAEQGDEGGG